jgi:hypothetical protein
MHVQGWWSGSSLPSKHEALNSNPGTEKKNVQEMLPGSINTPHLLKSVLKSGLAM